MAVRCFFDIDIGDVREGRIHNTFYYIVRRPCTEDNGKFSRALYR